MNEAYPIRIAVKHDERLRDEIEATIASLDNQCGDPTLGDEERGECRELLDFLMGHLRRFYP